MLAKLATPTSFMKVDLNLMKRNWLIKWVGAIFF